MHVSSAPLILEGRQPSLLHTYWRAIRYPLEACSLSFSATFQIPYQIHHSLPSIAAIPVWYPAFSCHLRNVGTTIFCDPLTCAPTSTSPFRVDIDSYIKLFFPISYANSRAVLLDPRK